MAEPVLRVERLTKTFGERTAVHDVSFELAPGACLGVVGESGSGKTTLARMVMGLTPPSSGRIVCCGRDRSRPARSTREWRVRARGAQIVFQDPYTSLDPHQRVDAALAEVLRLHLPDAAARATRLAQLAELVGLSERQLRAFPQALSGGQRQRVAVARALAARPRLLILDEAVSALDVSIQAQVLNLLADIRDETGVGYLFISHDLAVVRQLADECLVMRRGRVVEQGRAADVIGAPRDAYTRLLRASVPRPGWHPRRRAS